MRREEEREDDEEKRTKFKSMLRQRDVAKLIKEKMLFKGYG